MSENYQELMKQIDASVNNQFSSDSGLDQFFMHVLDGFGYRYLEDEKCQPMELKKVAKAVYQVSGRTFSMTKALANTSGEQKSQLVSAIKEAMNFERATSLQKVVVDAKELTADGQGMVRVFASISWDFPKFTDSHKQILKEHHFDSDDWGGLRKNFALFMEEVCELF